MASSISKTVEVFFAGVCKAGAMVTGTKIMNMSGGLSGGLGSWSTSGSFWDGLRQGLITSALNHAMHMAADNCCSGGDPLQELYEKAGYRFHDGKVYDPQGTQLPDNVPWYEYLADQSSAFLAAPLKALTARFNKSVATSIDKLIAQAQKLYPNKAGKIELHHIEPKYLGGPANGKLVPLDAAYHQQITNEFRKAWNYGQGPVKNPALRLQIMNQVYIKFPLPK